MRNPLGGILGGVLYLQIDVVLNTITFLVEDLALRLLSRHGLKQMLVAVALRRLLVRHQSLVLWGRLPRTLI